MNYIKDFIDYLSYPTISFTLLTVMFPFIFPPSDWFDKKNKEWGIYKVWSNEGGFWIFILITLFFLTVYLFRRKTELNNYLKYWEETVNLKEEEINEYSLSKKFTARQ